MTLDGLIDESNENNFRNENLLESLLCRMNRLMNENNSSNQKELFNVTMNSGLIVDESNQLIKEKESALRFKQSSSDTMISCI